MSKHHSADYLRGFKCALNIENYMAEIEADFQGIGESNCDFEKGFSDASHADDIIRLAFRTTIDSERNFF